MEEALLLRLAMITSIMGLVSILFLVFTQTLPLNEQPEGEQPIRIRGTITNIKDYAQVSIVQIQHPTTTPVVFFEPTPLKQGMVVDIIGDLTCYQGKQEVLAENIEIISS